MQNKFWFFGSKLNTALLLILIILTVFAIHIMLQNKETYLPEFTQKPVFVNNFINKNPKGIVTKFTKDSRTLYILSNLSLSDGYVLYDENGNQVAGCSIIPNFKNPALCSDIKSWSEEIIYEPPH